jgi:hypothetical protein
MRTMIGAVSITAILFAAVWTNASAAVSVEVSVGSPGYVLYNDRDYDDMDREDLIVIDNSQVGFWVMLPSGRWVFRCRSMWYDNVWDEWHYGPWWDNYSIAFAPNCSDAFHLFHPYHGSWYHSYMHNHYPRYWERNYGHRRLPFHDRLDRHAFNPRFDNHGDRNMTSRMAPGNHPTKIIETTRIITPDRTHSPDRDGALRKSDNRQPGVSAPAPDNSRSRTMDNNSRPTNKPSSQRNNMRHELGRR